jgi:hypothetical protein
VESAVALLLGSVAADLTAGTAESTGSTADSAAGVAGLSVEGLSVDGSRDVTEQVANLVPRQRPSGEWTTTGVLPASGGDR